MKVAVVDVGKTNVKLVVVEGGRTLHRAVRPNASLPGPPYPHADTEGVWQWLLEALAATPGREAIGAIVPVTHGCAAMLLAGDAPALPVLDYDHDGPDTIAEEWRAAADPFAASMTPDLPFGFQLGRQIFWQARAFPEAFARVTAILPYPQYWAWRLSGVTSTEVTSLACHAGLWRPAEGRYADVVTREGWLPLMPPLRRAWDTLGPVLPEVARRTGLSPGCRVLCGIHDSNASYLAHLAARPAPFTVLSTGTWMIILSAGAPTGRIDPTRDMLANVDATGAPVPTARFGAGREFERIAGPDGLKVAPSPADLAPLVARGTVALPAFVEGTGPFPHRRGGFAGPAAETPVERAALASLYCALVADVMLDLLGAAGPLIVEGPFAANGAFLAALGGLRPGATVVASADASGTAGGAALLAEWPPKEVSASDEPAPESRVEVPGLRKYRDAWRALL